MVIITASWPPEACGVGDYSKSLFDALTAQRIPASVYFRKNWEFGDLSDHVRAIHSLQDPLVNLQYPTEGYSYSIVPQLLTFFLRRKRVIVTLHEFTRKSLIGQIAIFLFFLSAQWIVFTTEEERNAACRVAPWIRGKSNVIPIGSSIPSQDPKDPDTDLAYFGLIRPGKGLEQFAEVLRLLRGQRSLKVRVIGQLVSGYESYSDETLQLLASEGAELQLNRSPDQVSDFLSRTRVVLLPFPDGISSRRSSALAAMANGALLVTMPPKSEFAYLNPYCVTAPDTVGLAQAVLSTLSYPNDFEQIRLSGQIFARNIRWPEIARQYRDVARRMVQI